MEQTVTRGPSKLYRTNLLLADFIQDKESGGWCAAVWGLPGCATQGETEQEASEALVEVYKLFVKSSEEDGEPLQWDASFRHWEGKGEMRWVSYD